MHKVVINAEVEDAVKWEEGFRTHGDLFRRQTVSNIEFKTTDSNRVVICFTVGDLDTYLQLMESEETAEAMNLTSTELPPEVNEFDLAGVTALASVAVAPPRVAESPVQFECRVTHIIDLSEDKPASSVVIGRVLRIHVSDEVLYDGDKIVPEALDPIGRLAGWMYCRVNDFFEMPRPKSRIRRTK